MKRSQRVASIALVMLVLRAASGVAVAAEEIPLEWLTHAEATRFSATSSYDGTLAFLKRVAPRVPGMRIEFFGESASGRPLPLVVVAGPDAATPEAAAASGKPVIWIQSGIHGGEIDGKDASLMILRDLALGRHRELLDGMVLLILPIYNVDGHERVSPYNRPNQDGPRDGMGFRTTADGHDLNRDHLKLETPEARALMRLFNRWRPQLHVDNHVTDGSEHEWVLTYSWVEGPQAPPTVAAWLDAHMPRVAAATAAAGHPVGPYVSLIDRDDPTRGFSSYVGQPRYATGYFPLRNRPSILVENHSYKPYEDRVRANRDFLLALLAEVARDPAALVRAVAEAERRTVELGAGAAEPSRIVVRWAASAAAGTHRFPVYEWFSEPSVAMGIPLLRYRRGRVREIDVPWVHGSVPAVAAPRPRGYAVLPGWPAIEQRLAGHGLRVERLDEAVVLDAETFRVTSAEPVDGGSTYQGLRRIAARVERATEHLELPPGTLWVGADQPDFEVAVQLLEPEASDSLLSWGLLSIALERKEYIDPRVLEGLVREKLEDPRTAEEWRRALEEEPELAGDPWARWTWWYRRTPYWDETVGRLPILRVLRPLEARTSRWTGPRPE